MTLPMLSVAPLEGLTGWGFRQTHHRFYPGADRYYTPFLSPIPAPGLTPRAMREVVIEHNENICVIPQLLTNSAEDFCVAAHTLASLGYTEVNLNLGCPSGTVVAKGKASGMLNDPDAVDRLLDGIFSCCPISVSVKTRIGRYDASEIEPLMTVYNRYPIKELTVHPRIRTQMYRGQVDLDAFSYVLSIANMPVCYNGDLFRKEDADIILNRFPNISGLMFGRGVITNPSLLNEVRGLGRTDAPTLRAYHDELLSVTVETLFGEKHVMNRMKEIWFYLIQIFEDGEKWAKKIRKCNRLDEYRVVVDDLFVHGTIGENTHFQMPLPPS